MNHVRMAVYEVAPGRTDEVVALERDELVPRLRKQRGFVSYEIAKIAHDRLVSYSVWASKRDAQDASGAIKQFLDVRLGGVVIRTEILIGELACSTNVPTTA